MRVQDQINKFQDGVQKEFSDSARAASAAARRATVPTKANTSQDHVRAAEYHRDMAGKARAEAEQNKDFAFLRNYKTREAEAHESAAQAHDLAAQDAKPTMNGQIARDRSVRAKNESFPKQSTQTHDQVVRQLFGKK